MMVITKDWLKSQLDESVIKVKQFEEKKDFDRGNIELGKVKAFEITYQKLTEPPSKKIVKKKFDADKAYESIVRYYMDKKGYTKEHANEIAKHAVNEQQARLT